MNQLPLFPIDEPEIPLWTRSPCEGADLTPEMVDYIGKRRFTKHDWCARHYVGVSVNGSIEPCRCECHAKAV